MPARDLLIEQSLPVNLDAERFVLGGIMTDEAAFLSIGGKLTEDDFSLEKHKIIFRRMSDLHDRSERIDRVTLANELMKHGELQSVDGLSYLVTLDDGLPQIYNLESYFRIVKDKSIGRQGILLCQHLMNELASQIEPAPELLRRAELLIRDIGGQAVQPHNMRSPAQIIDEAGGVARFLEPQSSVGVLTP